MNNRDYKQFALGSTYHVYNRGVGKMNIFLDDEDRLFFLKRLKEALYPQKLTKTMGTIVAMVPIAEPARRSQLPADSFDLLCYCIMPNHFHFVFQQKTELPISSLMSKLCTSYSKYFNKKYNRVGTLFQDQFKAVLVESNEQLLWLVAYVHQNPLKAGLVKDLDSYVFSSHPDYLGKRNGLLCKKDLILNQVGMGKSYLSNIMGFEDNLISNELKID